MQKQHDEISKEAKRVLDEAIKKMLSEVENLDRNKRSFWRRIEDTVSNFFGFWKVEYAKIQEIVNTAEDVEIQKRTYWLNRLMTTFHKFAKKYPEISATLEFQNGSAAVIKAAEAYEKVLIKCKKMMEEFHKMTDKERIKALNHVKSTWSDFLNVVSLGFFKRY
jgi:hypothetical protein